MTLMFFSFFNFFWDHEHCKEWDILYSEITAADKEGKHQCI